MLTVGFLCLGAGDWNLFCTLEAPLLAAIPQDTCEWRRSYGRVTKSVSLDASFVKYNSEKLQIDNTWNLLKRPILHVYWTDCVVSSISFNHSLGLIMGSIERNQ